MNLTIEQRDRLLAILPHYDEKPVGRKRADVVKVFLGILWVLESGAKWTDLDKRKYASFQTCHRYFQEWVEDGTFERALETLVRDAEDDGLLALHESFMDGSFARAKKGAMKSGFATKAKAVS